MMKFVALVLITLLVCFCWFIWREDARLKQASKITGTLAIANGGTGTTSCADRQYLTSTGSCASLSNTVSVRSCDTHALATLYVDKNRVLPLANPFLANADGSYEFYILKPGCYSVEVR